MPDGRSSATRARGRTATSAPTASGSTSSRPAPARWWCCCTASGSTGGPGAIRSPGWRRPGFRVVAPDLRGYGDSDKTQRGYDAFTLADDVAGLVRCLGERDAVLVGHGYGGVTAFDTAVMKPGQVRGVVAIAAPHPIRMARIRRPVHGRPVRPAADLGRDPGLAGAAPGRRQRRTARADRPVAVRTGLEGLQRLHRDDGQDAAGDPDSGRGQGRGRAPALGRPLAVADRRPPAPGGAGQPRSPHRCCTSSATPTGSPRRRRWSTPGSSARAGTRCPPCAGSATTRPRRPRTPLTRMIAEHAARAQPH